jgi:hypothetical protein
MPSSFKFNRSAFQLAMGDLRMGVIEAATEAMEQAVAKAAKDAQTIKAWRDEGWHEQDYPSGHWRWEVTGMAKSSIQGYVVPNKTLQQQPTYGTVSYWNGMPKQKIHSTNDSVTGSYSEERDRVIGIVTMNVAYAAYLQDWEMTRSQYPVTVEVFEMNWSSVYVPRVIRPVMERVLGRIARKYT